MFRLISCRRFAGLLRGVGLVAALGCVAVVIPSSAAASDTFTLLNAQRIPLASEVTWYRNGKGSCGSQDVYGRRASCVLSVDTSHTAAGAPSCMGDGWGNPLSWTGPEKERLPTLGLGVDGTIEESRAATSVCTLGDNGTPWIIGTAEGYRGFWAFYVDDPFIGAASITGCYAQGEAAGVLAFNINQDGLQCTVYGATTTPDASLAASVAAVGGGRASVPLQLSQKETNKASDGPNRPDLYDVILESQDRHVIGRDRVTLRVGEPRAVEVPISKAIRQQIRKTKSHQVTVDVEIEPVGGQGGTTDHSTLILGSPNRALHFH